jgi:hypothetical protein
VIPSFVIKHVLPSAITIISTIYLDCLFFVIEPTPKPYKLKVFVRENQFFLYGISRDERREGEFNVGIAHGSIEG